MKKMDVIAYCLIGIMVLFVIGACQGTEKASQACTGKFRIPLQNGDGPNGPGGTPSEGGTWHDAAIWQAYLMAKGTPYTTILGSGYPNNKFDGYTESATRTFQTLNHMTVVSGKVDAPTFKAANLPNPPCTCTPPFHLQ